MCKLIESLTPDRKGADVSNLNINYVIFVLQHAHAVKSIFCGLKKLIFFKRLEYLWDQDLSNNDIYRGRTPV